MVTVADMHTATAHLSTPRLGASHQRHTRAGNNKSIMKICVTSDSDRRKEGSDRSPVRENLPSHGLAYLASGLAS
ncbi:hypothetical protein E2C01_013185 [Portunus trituberculatus]|uniref:Uncharacterized protein n=1 Tax=Portunus trituberculatus TaxID=210409 RepID=A0A5B7DGE8_PORTR|nr:hypothetical protein [Portunus trituberculatus]